MHVLVLLLHIILLFVVALLHVAYATYFERKIIGHMQVRLGPTEAWHFGLLQPFADGIKCFFKEDVIPAQADRLTFRLAPIVIFTAMCASLAVLPFAPGWVIADIDIGLLFIFAMSGLGSYGVVLAGWASNSKYSVLGGLRSMAQIISYEIAMGLSLVGVMLLSESLNLSEIVRAQEGGFDRMYLFPQFIGFCVFFVAMLAETNRVPFDLPEAESELVSGYSTEYSGLRYAMFFMAEYVGMLVMSSIAPICFLGGWIGPWETPFFPPFWFMLKVYAFMFVFVWIRATMPRYRYDQLMALGWRWLIPLALANIALTALCLAIF